MTIVETGNPELDELIYAAAEAAEAKKALELEVIDISKISDLADYVLICSGESAAQLKAISQSVEGTLSAKGIEPNHKEGKYGDKWFLLDYTDFIVHIIEQEAREFYNLEELYSKGDFLPPRNLQ